MCDECSCAGILLKANLLIGAFDGLLGNDEERFHALNFGNVLISMAQSPNVKFEGDLYGSVFCISQIRRVINSRLCAARSKSSASDSASASASDSFLSFAALDLLYAAFSINSTDRIEDTPILYLCTQGEQALRGVLSDISLFYVDKTTDRSALGSSLVDKFSCVRTCQIVARALTTQVLASLFDSTRLAAGARIANTVFGDELAPLHADVERAEMARADAFAVSRVYAALNLVVALMFMGCAKRAEQEGSRDSWSSSSVGRAAIEFRDDVGDILKSYDEKRRSVVSAPSGPSGEGRRAYSAQTPGSVAALQERAAFLALNTLEENSQLLEAMYLGFGSAKVFRISADLEFGKCTYWAAVSKLASLRENCYAGHSDGRVCPVFNSILTMNSMILPSAIAIIQQKSAVSAAASPSSPSLEGAPGGLVHLTESMQLAMLETSKNWPSVDVFFGREFRDSRRKIAAKAKRENRDSNGRETGEMLGYSAEWARYLVTGPPNAIRHATSGVRVGAAVTSLAASESLARDGISSPLVAPFGNSAHLMHAVSLTCDPTNIKQKTRLVERGDDAYRAALAAADPLERKKLFAERIVERATVHFKEWSGAAIATDMFGEFFAAVWAKFNAQIRLQNSATVEIWKRHYLSNSTPMRGDSKLMFAWKVMNEQKKIAVDFSRVWFDERIAKVDNSDELVAERLNFSLVFQFIKVMDFAPFAQHIQKFFCGKRESKKRRRLSKSQPDLD